MDLEVSTWTRRDRLERIASAERDRRAGRNELALATLGEGAEWPARVVLALLRLPEDEGAAARDILERTLDAWAADSGLAPLDAVTSPDASVASDAVASADDSEEADGHASALEADESAAAPSSELAETHDRSEDAAEPIEPAPVTAALAAAEPSADAALDAPIAIDELDRAFAEAEAQTDEMLDVNTVAARVLMDEPMGLAEIDDPGPSDPLPGEPIETEAAWALSPRANEPAVESEFDVAIADVEPDERDTRHEADVMDAAIVEEPTGTRPRKQVIETLEQWLSNIERGRSARNAQPDRGA